MTTEQLFAFAVLNFPVVALILIGQRRGWWVDGKVHEDKVTSMKESYAELKEEREREAAFKEGLRQEAILDKKAVMEAAARQQEAIKELGNVVQQSLDFQERLVDELSGQQAPWNGEERRRGSARARGRARSNTGGTA